jgi:hypothetical protein
VMKEQGSGHLINISSVAGRKSGLFRGAYAGTKFAVNAISKALSPRPHFEPGVPGSPPSPLPLPASAPATLKCISRYFK